MVEQFLEHLPPVTWIILLAPLVSTLLITFFFLKLPKAAAVTSIAGIALSFVLSAWLFWFHTQNHFLPAETSYSWIQIAGLNVEFGFLLDQMSLLMLLVVTGVGTCVFVYSSGYMKGDPGYARYFASLSLFAFSMLGIVLANNFLMLFIFWELVAVSSYLLIGFWFEKPSAADAGNKAFLVNRLADFGMVLGIFYVWMLSGVGGAERTFNFLELERVIPALHAAGVVTGAMLLIASLLVFCGVVGKSAQFPLYIWLPDAMEGPTPVSALIHAATMVAAGVFMLSRSFFLVAGIHEALAAIAWIGAITALLAALLALVQNDIKKILAYSTVSQLGFMVMALGFGSPVAAMYHLTTHAFFKACLFLGAGSMIHALHTQEIWEMGGLKKGMPITSWTFIISTLALAGIPPLSGFFSKDEIILLAFEHNKFIYGIALFTAALTAFYMTRAVWVAILGERRKKAHSKHDKHAKQAHDSSVHESPLVMTLPLVILAFLAVIGGFLGIPQWIMGAHAHPVHLDLGVAATSTAVAVAGILLGTLLYKNAKTGEDPVKKSLGGFYRVLANKYYLDEFFAGAGRLVSQSLARLLFWFDWNVVIEKGVNGVAHLTSGTASFVRKAQTGRIETYAMAFAAGVVALVFYVMLRA